MFALIYFFFNDTATTEIYTLSLHDALPISLREGADEDIGDGDGRRRQQAARMAALEHRCDLVAREPAADRKSTRLNSSHANISYAVFCLKKKKNQQPNSIIPHSLTPVHLTS